MTNLQQLLEEKYPDSEISHIQRSAFEEGWRAMETKIKQDRRTLDDLQAFYNPIQDHSDFNTIK